MAIFCVIVYKNYFLYAPQEWKEKKELETKTKLAENSRYKMYRRYMKKGGPGQMTFGPD